MKQQRGDVGALFGGMAVLIGIVVGISFVLIALHYGNKRAQAAVRTMGKFTPPPTHTPKRHRDPDFKVIS